MVHFLPTGSLVNLKETGLGANIPDAKGLDKSSGVDANIEDTIINDNLKPRIKGRRRNRKRR